MVSVEKGEGGSVGTCLIKGLSSKPIILVLSHLYRDAFSPKHPQLEPRHGFARPQKFVFFSTGSTISSPSISSFPIYHRPTLPHSFVGILYIHFRLDDLTLSLSFLVAHAKDGVVAIVAGMGKNLPCRHSPEEQGLACCQGFLPRASSISIRQSRARRFGISASIKSDHHQLQ